MDTHSVDPHRRQDSLKDAPEEPVADARSRPRLGSTSTEFRPFMKRAIGLTDDDPAPEDYLHYGGLSLN